MRNPLRIMERMTEQPYWKTAVRSDFKPEENSPWKDLPEDVWLDTMKCFSRFVGEHRNSYGWEGFDRGFWTVRQVRASLFRLGELEYEMVESGERKHISLHVSIGALFCWNRSF